VGKPRLFLQQREAHRGDEGHEAGGRGDGHEDVPASVRNLAGVDGSVQPWAFRGGRPDAGPAPDARVGAKPQGRSAQFGAVLAGHLPVHEEEGRRAGRLRRQGASGGR